VFGLRSRLATGARAAGAGLRISLGEAAVGLISSVMNNTIGAGWHAVKNTVRGAAHGEVDDIARLALVAGMATGNVPVATGVVALAGESALGGLIDTFA
jgi:hypothetical protein